MNSLTNVYNSYGELKEEMYFAHCFDTIPTQLHLRLPLAINKSNLETILEELDFRTYEIALVFKGWRAQSEKNVDESEDFPSANFYKSKTRALCLSLSACYDQFSLYFYYNAADLEVEQWVLSTFRALREKFGQEKDNSPVFRVLAKDSYEFYTESITINPMDLDVAGLYNDDFLEVDATIDKSLGMDMSGLILLHGSPGTGKTSYIKYMLSKHRDRNFIFVPNDFVKEILQPGFITFLIRNKNSILVIEDAEKVITARENDSNSVASTILQLTDGLFSDYLNIQIICTFNISIDKVDRALLRKGRMIAFYEFKELSLQKTNALLRELGCEASDKPMVLADIFNP